MWVGLQTGINQPTVVCRAINPDRGGNKPLHQITFRGTNIGFV